MLGIGKPKAKTIDIIKEVEEMRDAISKTAQSEERDIVQNRLDKILNDKEDVGEIFKSKGFDKEQIKAYQQGYVFDQLQILKDDDKFSEAFKKMTSPEMDMGHRNEKGVDYMLEKFSKKVECNALLDQEEVIKDRFDKIASEKEDLANKLRKKGYSEEKIDVAQEQYTRNELRRLEKNDKEFMAAAEKETDIDFVNINDNAQEKIEKQANAKKEGKGLFGTIGSQSKGEKVSEETAKRSSESKTEKGLDSAADIKKYENPSENKTSKDGLNVIDILGKMVVDGMNSPEK